MVRHGSYGNEIKKTCFVICPIDEEGSEIRKWSDKILNFIIQPAADSAGYKVIRSDKITSPGMISTQIISHLKDSDVVIADLSYSNPNVFYEYAIRHITKKPYIQLMKANQKLPFDIASNRTIKIDTDVEIANIAKKELEKQFKSIEDGKIVIDNPIGHADIILNAESSGNTDQISNAKIFEIVSEMQSQLFLIKRKMEEYQDLKSLLSPLKDAAYGRSKINELQDLEKLIGRNKLKLLKLKKQGGNEREISDLENEIDSYRATQNQLITELYLTYNQILGTDYA